MRNKLLLEKWRRSCRVPWSNFWWRKRYQFFSFRMKGHYRQYKLFWAENIIFVLLSFQARAYLHEIISLQPHEIHSNILITGFKSNRLEQNKTKVEITRVFEFVLQCSVFLKHISDCFRVQSRTQHTSRNNTSFQNLNNWFRVRLHLMTGKIWNNMNF